MVDPRNVISPKTRLTGPIEVVYPLDPDAQADYSIARFTWDKRLAVGIRWNGDQDSDADVGNPQSRGLPTWFILPEEVADLVLDFFGASAAGEESKSGLEKRMEMVAERVLLRLLEERAVP